MNFKTEIFKQLNKWRELVTLSARFGIAATAINVMTMHAQNNAFVLFIYTCVLFLWCVYPLIPYDGE